MHFLANIREQLSRGGEVLWSLRRDIGVWVGVLCTGVAGFEAGVVWSMAQGDVPPVVIERLLSSSEITPSSPVTTSTSNTVIPPPTNSAVLDASRCFYVGSRNSTKYHRSTCAVAKRIKSANRVCFASPEEATAKGYTAGCVR